MDKEQYIQNYILGKVSDSDKETFEKLLETDLEFKYAYEDHKDLTAATKLQEAKEIKSKLQELESKNISQVDKKTGFSKAWYLAIASILLVGFFLTTNTPTSGEDLYKSNFSIYPNTYQPITRGNSKNTSLKAFVAYENSDFEKAELAFEKLLQMEANPNIQFYYAMSLLSQSKYDMALTEFVKLNKTNYEYTSESTWYTALIYLKQEDFKKAKESLERLNTLNSNFKMEERKELLEELEDF
jgi:tetratricopeptide (TPR) repeat protein